MTTTSALGVFAVYGPPNDELGILDTADKFRRELVALHHERHRATIELRDRQFPDLLPALTRKEQCYARISQIERAINAHHSDVRDRNAVTPEQRAQLTEAREAHRDAKATAKAAAQPWYDLQKQWRQWWSDALPAEERKNCKVLSKRRELYAALQPPEELAGLAALHIDYDLRQRELDQSYAGRLHYTVRGEIAAASKPKTSRTGPGMRYRYGRMPDVRPWTLITTQIMGGLTVRELLEGRSRQVSLSMAREQPTKRKTYYVVRQQVGTMAEPCLLEYRMGAHRELPLDAVVKRWTLRVEGRQRRAIPILTTADESEITGTGVVTYQLGWRRRKKGVEVARFWGEHICERLVVENWMLERRMAVSDARMLADQQANDMLAKRGATPKPGGRQGLMALTDYVRHFPQDSAAANLLDDSEAAMRRALRISQRAARCIEDLYKNVAARVTRLHAEIRHDPKDLARLKRYATRDLLREDKVPRASREYLFAAAPGKLRECFKNRGLPDAASDVVLPEPPEDARETDVFTTYVRSRGVSTGPKPGRMPRRSQHGAQGVGRQDVRGDAVTVAAHGL